METFVAILQAIAALAGGLAARVAIVLAVMGVLASPALLFLAAARAWRWATSRARARARPVPRGRAVR
jgi:hypothetical protein